MRLSYGSGSVDGFNAFDQVCLEPGMCTDTDFAFLLVARQSGLDFLEAPGLIGLSPRKFDSNSELFLE